MLLRPSPPQRRGTPPVLSYNSLPIPALPPSIDLSYDASTDYRMAKAKLIGMGALLLFFTWNSLTALSYIRRSRAKNNLLFYLLLASQVPGVAGVTVLIVADFVQSIDCTVVGIVMSVCAHVANALMFTGIMGIKAYRCLGNCPLVIVVLVCIRGVMLVFLGIEVPQIRERRTAIGTCLRGHDPPLLRYILLLQFIEAVFLCGCFLIAVWKSTHTTVDQRLSIRVVLDGMEDTNQGNPGWADGQTSTGRGWWDYVPEAQSSYCPSRGDRGRARMRALVHAISAIFRRLFLRRDVPPAIVFHRKPSLPGEYPIHQPPRHPSTPLGGNVPSSQPRKGDSHLPQHPHHAYHPPTMSAIDCFLKKLPRRELLLQMLRNELLYTTLLAAAFLGAAILLIVGLTDDMAAGADLWATMDWVIVSALTMHSFTRVIRRHEFDAVMQHPSAWASAQRADIEASIASRRSRTRSPVRPSQFRPHRRDVLASGSASIRTSMDRSSEMLGSPIFVDTLHLEHLYKTQSSHDLSISPTTLYAPSPSITSKSHLWNSPPTLTIPSDLGDHPSLGGASFGASIPFIDPQTGSLPSAPPSVDPHDFRHRDSQLPEDYNR